MNGDIIVHSVEIEGYWRTSPGGRRVFVKAYRRDGNARQDDLYRKSNVVNQSKNWLDYHRQTLRFAKTPGSHSHGLYEYNADVRKEINDNVRNAEQKYVEALKRAEVANPASIIDKAKYAVVDAVEEAQVAVGNFIADSKVKAVDILEDAKSEIDDGIYAVKSFFSRLFGRR